MEGEAENKPAEVSAPGETFSGELPIRTRQLQDVAASAAENEAGIEKVDKEQPTDGEDKNEIEVILKEDGVEPEKDGTETKKKKKKKRGNRSGKNKVGNCA